MALIMTEIQNHLTGSTGENQDQNNKPKQKVETNIPGINIDKNIDLNNLSEDETQVVMNKVQEMFTQSGKTGDLGEFYKRLYNESFSGQISQIKQFFSLLFIMIRDALGIPNGHTLKIGGKLRKGGTLNVRDENGKVRTTVQDGQKIEYLGEKKVMLGGQTFIKVKFKRPSGTEVTGYVAENYTEGYSKEEKYLDGYLKQLGYSPITTKLKANIYKDIFGKFSKYNPGNSKHNLDIYHYLVQKNEIGSLIGKYRLSKLTQDEIDKLRQQNAQRQSEREKNRKKQQLKAEQLRETLEKETNEILDKIKNDSILQGYLDKKYNGSFSKFCFDAFGSGGYNKTDISSTARGYACLYMRANATNKRSLELWQYCDKIGLKDRKKQTPELLEKYGLSISFYNSGEQKNTKIFYGLVIENELGKDVLDLMDKANNVISTNFEGKVELERAYLFNPNDFKIGPPLYFTNNTNKENKKKDYKSNSMGKKYYLFGEIIQILPSGKKSYNCSESTKENLKILGVTDPDEGHSKTLIHNLKYPNKKGYQGGIDFDLVGDDFVENFENCLRNIPEKFNIIDIYPNTTNSHRAMIIKGIDNQFYVIGSYYGKDKESRYELQPLGERLIEIRKRCNEIIIGKRYLV
ncbi:MAG: SH3 domain-containing protein [Candidatus Gracilibacteria bacterium]|nr:SH3 domain-containing protein [Candidatus Gracilibacteria bacterium]